MTDQLNKEEKVTILLSALSERYNAQHVIRERVQNIGIWALGILLGAGGWIIQSEIVLTVYQKIIFILGILVAFVVLRFRYITDLHIGFRSQQRVAARIEKTLGLFTPRIFDDKEETIYPEKWQHAGSEKGGGKFFDTTCLLLYVGVGFLIITILLSRCPNYNDTIIHHLGFWRS